MECFRKTNIIAIEAENTDTQAITLKEKPNLEKT